LWRENILQVKKANSGTRMATAPRITREERVTISFVFQFFPLSAFLNIMTRHVDEVKKIGVRKLRI
jgi:ABC-type histidine transport system ATPase subunit